LYSREKLVDLCEGAMSTRWKAFGVLLPDFSRWHHMICQVLTVPQGGADMKMSPMLGPIVRWQHKQLVSVATVLRHKSNVGTTLVKVVFLLFILCSTNCFSIRYSCSDRFDA
jgi:hypothetical protein